MHYIDLDEIEVELPSDWEETVESAKAYVESKILEAEEDARAEAIRKGWGEEQTIEYIESEKIKARKKAINAKSSVWSSLSTILSTQSHGKCWYCETYEIRSDNPIDHFRPKNSVKDCVNHPGYWWLAFEWSNYRYSCTYCNSRRIGIDTSGGKGDYFPLLPPCNWNRCETDTYDEHPLLLDPCDIDDSKLLAFNINGKATPITDDELSDEYLRADTSINLYHLNHGSIVRERRIISQKIRQLVSNTNELLTDGLDARSEQIKANKKDLIKMIRASYKFSKFNTAAKLYLREYNNNEWVADILKSV